MESRIKDWLLALHTDYPDTIGDLFQFEFLSCDVEKGHYSYRVHTRDWMCNPNRVLHGGISATIIDQGMGLTATCIKAGESLTPSIQLNLAYHKPIIPGSDVILEISVDTITRTHLYMHADLYSEEKPRKLCVSGSGIYYCIPI